MLNKTVKMYNEMEKHLHEKDSRINLIILSSDITIQNIEDGFSGICHQIAQ